MNFKTNTRRPSKPAVMRWLLSLLVLIGLGGLNACVDPLPPPPPPPPTEETGEFFLNVNVTPPRTPYLAPSFLRATASYKYPSKPGEIFVSLKRFGRTVKSVTGNELTATVYLPGEYKVRAELDTLGDSHTREEWVLVYNAWWKMVPRRRYNIIPLPQLAPSAASTDVTPYPLPITVAAASDDWKKLIDPSIKIVELILAGYSSYVHDWAAAEWINPETGETLWLFNRVRQVRFRDNMAELFYALTVSGDADWWSGCMNSNTHWNLAAGSSDRTRLSKYRLLSVQRIDHPPVNPRDKIAYYQ